MPAPWEDPILIISALGIAWILTQIVSLFAAKWVIGRAQDFSNEQRDEIQTHFDAQLADLDGKIGGFEARLRAEMPPSVDGRLGEMQAKFDSLQEDFSTSMAGIQEDIETVSAAIKGLPQKMHIPAMEEKRAFQAALAAQGKDLEDEGSIMEALAAEDPELLSRMAMKRVAEFQPSEKWAQEHPLLYAAMEAGKPMILQHLSTIFTAPGSAQATGRRSTAKSPYGV